MAYSRCSLRTDVIKLRNDAGRFHGVRFISPISVEDAMGFSAQVQVMLATYPGRAIFCCDARRLTVLSPQVFDLLTSLMRSDRPKVERNAIFVGESSVFGLQVERMLRATAHPGRRAFRTESAIIEWLSEVLTPSEVVHLTAFLAGEGDTELTPASGGAPRSRPRGA